MENKSIISILSYCLSSILMTIVNKYILSGLSHSLVFLMLAVQGLACILLIQLFGRTGFLKFREFNIKDAKAWLPVSILMAIMLYTGGKSLQYLSVPLFTIFKNLSIIMVAYGEFVMFKSKVTTLMIVSFSLMILSSIVGGWNDIQFNLMGYIWMILNCISSSIFVLYMRKQINKVNFKDFDTVYFNNLLTFPIFITFSLLLENWPSTLAFYYDPINYAESLSLLKGLVVSGFSAFAISYTSAWCIRVTNSTTYSMVGSLNKLPIAIFAMIYFKDPVTFGNLSAVLLAFFSGIVYTHAKTKSKKQSEVSPANNSIAQYEKLESVEKEVVLPVTKEDLS